MTTHHRDGYCGSLVTISHDELAVVSGGGLDISSSLEHVSAFVKGSVAGVKLANRMYGDSTWQEKWNDMGVMRTYFLGEFDAAPSSSG